MGNKISNGVQCPGLTPKAQEIAALRHEAKPVPFFAMLRQGPPIPFSFRWLFGTSTGLIQVQTFFWVIKDWSWCQLKWFYPAIIFGSLAVLFGIFLVSAAIYFRLWSEASVAFGLLIWLISNYWWMVGEIWGYQVDPITSNHPRIVPEIFKEYEDGADRFYDQHTIDAQKINTVAATWLALSIFIFPFFFNDRDQRMMQEINSHAPRYRFRWFFRDFTEYENVHIFFWCVKDTFWAYGNANGWAVFFAFTLLFASDSVYLLATSSNHMLEFVQGFTVFLWILGNGVWAGGELFVEDRAEDLPDRGYDQYRFLPYDKEFINFFLLRNLAGWVFAFAMFFFVSFYVYWIFFFPFMQGKRSADKMKELEYDYYNDSSQSLERLESADGKPLLNINMQIHGQSTMFEPLQIKTDDPDVGEPNLKDNYEVSDSQEKPLLSNVNLHEDANEKAVMLS